MPEWLTVQQASDYLKVTRSTLYRYCDSGLLPYFELKSGGGRRFRREDLDSLLEQRLPNNSATEGGPASL